MTQKNLTIISMCSVVIAAVVVNELVLKASSADQDRKVASFSQRYEPDQIKWEQELAQTISKDSETKTLIATKPSAQDRFLFEAFEGRYAAELNLGKINKITLLPNQAPIEMSTATFLKDYAGTMKDFASYEIKSDTGASDLVNLKNKAGATINQLVISRDDKGRVLSIEIK